MFNLLPCRAKSTINTHPSSSRSSSFIPHSSNNHSASSRLPKTIELWIGEKNTWKGLGGYLNCMIVDTDAEARWMDWSDVPVAWGLMWWPGLVCLTRVDYSITAALERSSDERANQWRELLTTEPRGSPNQGKGWGIVYSGHPMPGVPV